MKKSRKRLTIVTLGAVLIVAGALIWRRLAKTDAVGVETQSVQRRTIVETVTASGKLQPEKEVKISADVSGQIVALKVKEGQQVQQGDLLARIDPDTYQAALERAQAALNNAQAQLASARAQVAQQQARLNQLAFRYQRNRRLYEEEAIAQGEFEAIKSDYEVAQAQLEAAQQTVRANIFQVRSARANVREARDNLRRTEIYAPMDGYISRMNVEQGERVVGTAQMQGTEMMRVADLNIMEVEVEVNENDIVRLEQGDSARIEVDALAPESFRGVVTEIANSAQNEGLGSDQATAFPVKLRILASSYQHLRQPDRPIPTPFRPGMSALVAINTQQKVNVLSVPILAVSTRDRAPDTTASGSNNAVSEPRLQTVVFVPQKDQARLIEVETGIQDDTYIEIRKGLQNGQTIIAGPYQAVSNELRDGKSIEIRTDSEAGRNAASRP